jgi:ribonuclease HI
MDPYKRPQGNEYDEGLERVFDPLQDDAHCGIPADQLIVYEPDREFQHIRYMIPSTGESFPLRLSIVVSIDGACRGNGTPSARAAWGVYFGPQSSHNSCEVLDLSLTQTSTRAEIEALSKALDIICNLVSSNLCLQYYTYYIRTDSAYLVNTFSRWIQTWIKKRGKNWKRKRPAHFDILR